MKMGMHETQPVVFHSAALRQYMQNNTTNKLKLLMKNQTAQQNIGSLLADWQAKYELNWQLFEHPYLLLLVSGSLTRSENIFKQGVNLMLKFL